jgi:NADH:ubiquinone oxidoreductase subunit 4 (subunit M)
MKKNVINFLFTKQKSNWFKAIKIQTNKKRKNNNNTYCRPAFLSSNHCWIKQTTILISLGVDGFSVILFFLIVLQLLKL